ncbi:MAG: DEAD/DEAH box helicase [Anaerolineae bacterium]|nr:DEAD/DEAH box helicase [Anaerolineae bacterium]
MYAEVVVNAPVSGTFHYHIPPELAGQVAPGCLVEVSFGRERQQAIVLRLDERSPVAETKPIARLLDATPVVGAAHIALAEWLSRETLSHLSDCLRLFLPPGLARRGDIVVTLVEAEAEPRTEVQKRVLSLLRRRGPLRGRQIEHALPKANWRAAVNQLRARGVVRTAPILDPPAVRPQMVRTARLAIPPDRAPAVARFLGHESKRADVLEVLMAAQAAGDPLPALDRVCAEADCTPAVVKGLEAQGMVRIFPRRAMVALAPGAGQEAGPAARPYPERAARVIAQLRARRAPVPRSEIDADAKTLSDLEAAGVIQRWEEPATVGLALAREDIVPAIVELRGGGRHLAVLEMLAREAERTVESIDVTWVYAQTGASLDDLRRLAEDGLIVLGEEEVFRDPLADRDFTPSEPPSLTAAQHAAWLTLRAAIDAANQPDGAPPRPFLVHGVTGSGKTELYMRALDLVIHQGRQGIILVPEISLTAQTVRRFAARFGRRLGIVHSGLSEGERYDTWRRARAGELDVIIGARSALFTPLPNLGLIVLDESHDDSYKQSPPVAPPYYHAREAAVALGRFSRATVILGTATPDLVSYFRAQRGDYRLLELPQRVLGHRLRVRAQADRLGVQEPAYHAEPDETGAPDAVFIEMPPVQVVDMRQELRAGNRSVFSRALRGALAQALAAGEQAILFMNRRGTATFILCRDCGYVHRCLRCDTPLTYHGPDRALICHHCGHQEPQPRVCPQCGRDRIRYFGVGTELIEQAVQTAFPQARVLRWDRDTTGAVKGAHELILEHFINGHADVLVGDADDRQGAGPAAGDAGGHPRGRRGPRPAGLSRRRADLPGAHAGGGARRPGAARRAGGAANLQPRPLRGRRRRRA